MKAWKWVALVSVTACGACGAEAGSNDGANSRSLGNNANLPERECAGAEALVCAPGKFCATAETNRCPSDRTEGTCTQIPETCADVYKPMCGCDGQTYDNDCRAAMLSVAIAYDGACAPFCGGFAGIPCLGAGTCIDNTTDGCDPAQGDVDCASLCVCEVTQYCDEGAHWDSSPGVCGCVRD